MFPKGSAEVDFTFHALTHVKHRNMLHEVLFRNTANTSQYTTGLKSPLFTPVNTVMNNTIKKKDEQMI